MERYPAPVFEELSGGSNPESGGSHPLDERTKALPIPFRAPLRWVYKRIPTRAQRLVRRLRARTTRQQTTPETRPDITILPSVTEVLNITPELVGSSYEPDEVLPMLALENEALRERLFESMDQADQLRDELAEIREAHGLHVEIEAPLEPELLVDEYLAGSPEPAGVAHLVVANDYVAPGREHSNAFVHRRVKSYQAAGIHVDVVAAGPSAGAGVYDYDGVRVLSGTSADIVELLRRRSYTSASVHFLNPDIWEGIEPSLAELNFHLFFHGYESSRWIRYASNYPTGNHLDRAIDRAIDLQRLWRTVVNHPHAPASYIFVSNWWKGGAMDDLGLVFPPRRTHVIHNIIDSDLFTYQPKDAEQRFHLLWVRSASARKYGHDMAIKIVQRLSRSRHWDKAQVTIVGDGQHFHEFQQQLGHFPNVTIDQRFVRQEEVARLHKRHGIFLVPSRHDTHGVARDEAMASGLVPATNLVMAIPEFIDAESGIVAGAEDAESLADGIEDLWNHPEKFLRLSKAAAERVRRQSGADNTVARELELFNLVPHRKGH